MRRKSRTYSHFKLLSAVFLILALLWLTISAPFVYAGQQRIAQQDQKSSNSPLCGNEEEAAAANPFGNTTEEKAPGNSSLSEEYLHDHPVSSYFFLINSQYHKCENADTYNAFHGELLVPPPNCA